MQYVVVRGNPTNDSLFVCGICTVVHESSVLCNDTALDLNLVAVPD
jgi:hypothetical protein